MERQLTSEQSSGFYYYEYDNSTSYTDYEWLIKYTVPIINSLIAITGLTGNGLVIFILLKFQNMRTIPNIYIFNLALFDFGFLCSLPFHVYQSVMKHWPFGEVFCVLAIGVDGLNMFASVYIVTAMSIDRYFAISFPLSSMQYRTRKFAKLICVAMWILSFIFSLPNWIFARVVEQEFSDDGPYCTIYLPLSDKNKIINATNFSIFALLFGFLFPLIIMSICYSTLLCKMRIQNFPSGSDISSGTHRASKRVTILTMSVVVVFVICWSPYYTTQLVSYLSPNENISQNKTFVIIHTLAICLCYSNSSVNPFIYTFVGENFKKNFSDLFPCIKRSPPFSRFHPGRESTQSTLYSRGNVHAGSTLLNRHGSLIGNTMIPSNSSSVNVALDAIVSYNESPRVYKSNSEVFGSKIVEEHEIPDHNMNENDALPITDNRNNVDNRDIYVDSDTNT